jgi:hypothetical protein
MKIGKDGPTPEQLDELKSNYLSDEYMEINIKVNVKYKVNGHFHESKGTIDYFGNSSFPLRTSPKNVIYVPYIQEPEIEKQADGIEEKVKPSDNI